MKLLLTNVRTFMLAFVLFSSYSSIAQTTEVFETETSGATSFTDNGQTFTISTQAGGNPPASAVFDIQAAYPGTGWNGSSADNRYIDNDGFANNAYPIQFTISSGSSFILNNFWIYVTDQSLNHGVAGSVTITGKLGGTTVYTATQSTGFTSSDATNNGFTFINLATYGSQNNSNKVIDQIVISTSGLYVYVALDAFNWSKTAPEINIQGNSVSIVDGDATPSATDHTDFGSQSACSGTIVRTFTIQNTGNSNLTISSVNISGTASADFSVTASPAATVAAAGSTTFQVTFNPSATGARNATITVNSNDTDEAAYDFAITGTGVDPEMNIQGNSTSIADGDATPSAADHTDFGSQSICSGTIVRTFTIQNTGNSNLAISSVNITGTASADFSVTTAPAATVAAAGSTTFQVTFNPSATGARNATITVNGNDCDEAAYDFAITGTGVDPEMNVQGNSTTIADGDATPSATDHTDFGSQSVCSGTIIRTFTIQNTGSSNLAISSVNITGTASADFSVTTAPAATVAAAGSTTFQVTFNPSAAGARNATITINTDDCDEAAYDFAVTGTGTNLVLTLASSTNVSCNSGSNGSATVNAATGGAGGYTYDWTPGAPVGDGTVSVSGLSAQVYTCTVTDAGSCTATATVNITEPSAVSASSSATAILCNGGNAVVTVSATGGTPSYSGTGTYTVTAGTYTYTVTDNNSCSANTIITVTQPSVLAASSSATTILCNGGTAVVTVSATGGTIPYSGTGTYTVTAGTYTYTVTDNNACSANTIITVTQPAALSASSSATAVLCNSGNAVVTVSATGGTMPYSGTGTYTVTAGTYTYTVTDNNSCSANTVITVNEPAALSASSSATTVLCNGGNAVVTVSATGGTMPYTGTGTYTVTAGTYTYTVSDNNSCSTNTMITVSEPSALSASSSATAILCNGGTAVVTVSATGGTVPYTGTGTYTVTAGTYTYTVSDNNGCSTNTMITVSEPSALSASSSATAILCNGGTAVVTVSATGGTMPYSGTGTYTVTAGTYTYTVTDNNTCSTNTMITVSEPAALSASSSATAILCNGGTAVVTVSAIGGTPAYSGTGTYTVTAGTYTYTVSDNNGCSTNTMITVSEPAALSVSSSATTILCNGGTAVVTVSASGGTIPYSGTGTYTVTAGTYTYTVSDDNGCTDDTGITINEPAVLATTQNISICSGQSVTVGANTYSASGTYTDILNSVNGCDSTVTTNLTVAAQITNTQNITVCAGGSITVGSHTYTVSGTYVDTIPAVGGCDSIITTNFLVENVIDVTTSVSSETITANATGAGYQWIDCDNGGSPVSGETGQSFTATANGNYAVIVTVNSCSDTSACVNISGIGIKEENSKTVAVKLYPNPVKDMLTIQVNSQESSDGLLITIKNAIGDLIYSEQQPVSSGENTIHLNLNNLQVKDGVYFVDVITAGKKLTQRIVVMD